MRARPWIFGIVLLAACGGRVRYGDAPSIDASGVQAPLVDASELPVGSSASSSSDGSNAVPDAGLKAPSAITGRWYTYTDRSIPNSEPPIIVGNPPGTIEPSEGAPLPPTEEGGLLYWECRGGGEVTWGAGFGMDLSDQSPDGGQVAVNLCPGEGGIFDTNPDASIVGIPQPYDASAYLGFAFWGISLNGKSQVVDVEVDDDQTSPWGGSCNACSYGGACPAGLEAGSSKGCPCSDGFIQQFTFKTGVWTQFVVRFANFAAFKPADWSREKITAFHPQSMYNIHFQFATTAGIALPPFDVAVAMLQWVTE